MINIDEITDTLIELQAAFHGLAPMDDDANRYSSKYKTRLSLYAKYNHLITIAEDNGFEVDQSYYEWAASAALLLQTLQPIAEYCDVLIHRPTKH